MIGFDKLQQKKPQMNTKQKWMRQSTATRKQKSQPNERMFTALQNEFDERRKARDAEKKRSRKTRQQESTNTL